MQNVQFNPAQQRPHRQHPLPPMTSADTARTVHTVRDLLTQLGPATADEVGTSHSTSDGARQTTLEDHITAWADSYGKSAVYRVDIARDCEANGVYRMPVSAQLQIDFDRALRRIFRGDRSPFALDDLAVASLALRGS